MRTVISRRPALIALAMLAIGALPASGQAQGRDPAYAAAREAGQVGEKPDGYLGTIGAVPPQVKKLVEDLNIKRKAVYAEKAQAQHVTIEDFAFTTGCHQISRTEPGEKYQGPDGAWHVRTAGPALRDARCP